MKKKYIVFFLMGISLVIAFFGCKKNNNIVGYVQTADTKRGVPDVIIGFSDVDTEVITDMNGTWIRSWLEAPVTITPAAPKDDFGWEFQPETITLSKADICVFRVKDLLYYDGFSNPDSGWPNIENENRSIGYKNEKIEMRTTRADYITWAWWEIFPKNYHVQVDIHPDEGEEGFGGIVFNAVNGKFYYAFVVSPHTGEYHSYRYNYEENVIKTDWTNSPYINAGDDVNRLKVVQKDNEAFFFINDNYVDKISIQQYTGDTVGAGICTGTGATCALDNPVSFLFDDFQVFSLSEDEDMGAEAQSAAFSRTEAAEIRWGEFGGNVE